MKLEGTSYEGRYLIVDVLLRSRRPTERLAWFDPPSNPGDRQRGASASIADECCEFAIPPRRRP